MEKKSANPIIDSRHLKILTAKKKELKDSIVFVCLHEEKFGYFDIAQLRKLAEALEKIEPDGCYFVGLKNLRINIFERSEIKNKDLIVTIDHPKHAGIDEEEVEQKYRAAFSEARSLKFVHHYASSIRRDVS